MIILIGGASCTGKTTMAQKLMEKHLIPYMSIDHIKMGIIRSNPNCGFTAEDPEDLVTSHMWPIMKEVIKTNIENDQNIIIEGCYIPTDDVMNFAEDYKKFIIPFYIGFSQRYIEEHFENGIINYRSETEYKGLDDYMKKEYFIQANKIQKERCLMNNQKFFEIEDNYEKDLKHAYKWVANKIDIKKKLKFNEEL